MNMKRGDYKKFGLMIVVSFFIMYFVMFLNVFSVNHIYLSLTRLYMALLMVSLMAISMLVFMRHMYDNKKLNLIIIVVSIVVFILALVLLRTQVPIGDVQYMKAMIPHHSSAILTSSKANIQDSEVRELANQIIESQEREIEQMEKILKRLG